MIPRLQLPLSKSGEDCCLKTQHPYGQIEDSVPGTQPSGTISQDTNQEGDYESWTFTLLSNLPITKVELPGTVAGVLVTAIRVPAKFGAKSL